MSSSIFKKKKSLNFKIKNSNHFILVQIASPKPTLLGFFLRPDMLGHSGLRIWFGLFFIILSFNI
jgi:hypothetical protein